MQWLDVGVKVNGLTQTIDREGGGRFAFSNRHYVLGLFNVLCLQFEYKLAALERLLQMIFAPREGKGNG